jgi:molybdate transport system substrate-binding protein
MRRAALVVLVALAAVAGAQAASRAQLTVYGAASLTDALPKIDPGQRYSFGGSNALAAQIEQGAPADVFASADTKLPNQLHARGLCSQPVVFTRNALVIVVPRANSAGVHSVYDLAKHGVKLVIADPGVPVGAYTLKVLKKMNLSAAVLKNVVSRETDVREVLAKVALGEADAGFVYSTDAKTVPGRVAVLKIPARAQPDVAYGACVVAASRHQAAAHAFVSRLLGKAAQTKLLAYGFLPRVER